MDGKISAKTGSHCKKDNDAEVIESFPEIFQPALAEIRGHGCRAAPQVSDTHRTGIGIAVNLTETLHLHGTGKGHQDRGQHIQFSRHETDDKKKNDLCQKDTLPPVKLPRIPVFSLDLFRYPDA